MTHPKSGPIFDVGSGLPEVETPIMWDEDVNVGLRRQQSERDRLQLSRESWSRIATAQLRRSGYRAKAHAFKRARNERRWKRRVMETP